MTLARLADRLTLVQLCGVTQPRGPNLLPKRCAIRDGVVDIRGTLDLLRRAGYRGHFEFELFARDLAGEEVNLAIQMATTDFCNFSTSGA